MSLFDLAASSDTLTEAEVIAMSQSQQIRDLGAALREKQNEMDTALAAKQTELDGAKSLLKNFNYASR